MANLIDGVIQAGSYVGVQCLQAVTDLTGIAVSAGGTAFNSAADLANWAKNTGNLSATPQLGDVAVWGAGQGGAAGAGHAGIVTGLGGGGVQVTSTNWPAGSGETQYTVGNNNVGMGAPLGYVNPTVLGGKNIITGATGIGAGLASAGSSVASAGPTSSDSGAGCKSLTEFIDSNAHGSSIPVVGGVIGAVTGTALFPVSVVEWGTQPCVRWTAGFWLLAFAMGGLGFYLLFRKQANAAIGQVGKVAAVAG